MVNRITGAITPSEEVSKINEIIDICNRPHIVQSYSEGTDWYRIWSDGWIEQGGKITTAGVNTTVQLLKEMDNTAYHCLISMDAPARPNPTYSIWFTYDQHSTYFKYYMSGGSSSYPMFWEVKGKMLQS